MFIKYKLRFDNPKEGTGPEQVAVTLGDSIVGKFYHTDSTGWIIGETPGLDSGDYAEFQMQEIDLEEVQLLASESGTGAFVNAGGQIELPKVIDIDLIIANQGE